MLRIYVIYRSVYSFIKVFYVRILTRLAESVLQKDFSVLPYCRLGADLTLCGHGHGGIWRLPFTDGLISTTMEWFPSWTNGFYTCSCNECDGSTVFVSRGLGNSPRIPRLFNRPEVAVITLENSP